MVKEYEGMEVEDDGIKVEDCPRHQNPWMVKEYEGIEMGDCPRHRNPLRCHHRCY